MSSTVLDKWLERGFLGLSSLVALYAANQLSDLNRSVQELNVKLTVYIGKVDAQDSTLKDHEARIRVVENRTKE